MVACGKMANQGNYPSKDLIFKASQWSKPINYLSRPSISCPPKCFITAMHSRTLQMIFWHFLDIMTKTGICTRRTSTNGSGWPSGRLIVPFVD